MVPGSHAYRGTASGNRPGNHPSGQQGSEDGTAWDTPAPTADTGHPYKALMSRQRVRPACGHAGASVVLTVKGRGQLCGDCWLQWVCGDLDWPVTGEEQS